MAEPVAVINGSIAIVEAVVALAAMQYGWDGKTTGLVMAIVVAVANLAKTLVARSQVTPVSDPRNNEGQHLVPEKKV